MTEKNWTPPLEFESETNQGETKEKTKSHNPVILAEEGEADYDMYLHRRQRIDECTEEDSSVNVQTEAIKRQITRRRHQSLKWLMGSAVLLLCCVLALDTFAFISSMYGRSLILGLLFTSLVMLLMVSLLVVAYEQIRDIRRLRDISRFQKETEQLRQARGHGRATALVERVSYLYMYRVDTKAGLEKFRKVVSDVHSDTEVLELFSKHVLHPLDDRASQIIANHASQSALLTALSPLAILDALLSLWRNVRMVREIAVLYGGHPGSLGTLKLVRNVVGNMTVAGVSDVMADTGAEAFGGTFAATLSAKVGQGIAMGMLTIRLGLITMRLCRPVSFQKSEQPRMANIRDKVLKTIYSSVNFGGKGS